MDKGTVTTLSPNHQLNQKRQCKRGHRTLRKRISVQKLQLHFVIYE